ncbi:MAG: thioredoxin [Chloroflexi bacterium]|nr:MAG: thioredoxin [Chloroflexota bacterium]
MTERLLLSLFIFAGLGLGWLVWYGYKNRLRQSIRPAGEPTGKPTLLYFTADYCSACKHQQTPIVAQVQARLGDAVRVQTVSVTDQPELAARYKVLTLPTTVVLDPSGAVAHLNYGVTSAEKLLRQLAGQPDRPAPDRPRPSASRPAVPAR